MVLKLCCCVCSWIISLYHTWIGFLADCCMACDLKKVRAGYLQSDDLGALKYQAAELTSRLELMQTQLSKAALAAERGAEDRSQLEAELASALDAAAGKADKSVWAAAATLRLMTSTYLTLSDGLPKSSADLELRIDAFRCRLHRGYNKDRFRH